MAINKKKTMYELMKIMEAHIIFESKSATENILKYKTEEEIHKSETSENNIHFTLRIFSLANIFLHHNLL